MKSKDETKVENFIKPRYKVIADYPMAVYGVGDILIPDKGTEMCVIEGGYWENDLSKYPSLFKPLFWWEERSPEEMPQYMTIKTGRVVKVEKHYVGSNQNMFEIINNSGCIFYHFAEPATSTEYLNYINKKQ